MFEFTTDFDKQMFISMTGLIKTNDGLFKSAKQSSFVHKQCQDYTPESAKNYFGVDITADQKMIKCEGMNRWADYGSRGLIPQMFIFVVDEHGIVAKWKVPYNGNLRIGATPAPERATKMWERTVDVSPVVTIPTPFPAPAVVVPVSEHIGQIGNKVELEVEIISVHSFSGQRMGYWDSGVRFLTTMKSGDNIIKYWGYPKFKNCTESLDKPEGVKALMKATVKDHGEYKGVKDTVVSRPTFNLI